MSPAASAEPQSGVRRARDDAWLSLGPASRLVGVDPDTLRRWADDGRLRAFATPGGHRRFDRRDLERLIATRQPRRRRLATLGATPERLARAYARSYRSALVGPERLGEKYAEADREAFRIEGRRLVAALLAYLDAGDADARTHWEGEAADAVRATGVRLAATGAGVLEAVSTFVAARRPFLTELAALGRRRALDVATLTALYDEAAALLDRLLLQLVAAFAPTPRTR